MSRAVECRVLVRAKFESHDGNFYEYFGPAILYKEMRDRIPTYSLEINHCENYIKECEFYEMFLSADFIKPLDFPKISICKGNDEISEFFNASSENINNVFIHVDNLENDGYFIVNHGKDKNEYNKKLLYAIMKSKKENALTFVELLDEIEKRDMFKSSSNK